MRRTSVTVTPGARQSATAARTTGGTAGPVGKAPRAELEPARDSPAAAVPSRSRSCCSSRSSFTGWTTTGPGPATSPSTRSTWRAPRRPGTSGTGPRSRSTGT